MKQSLQLRIGQSLTMTPQLQQAIKLLQLSSLELQTEIQQTLDANPLLDQDDNFGEITLIDFDSSDITQNNATLATVGKMTIPELRQRGYPESLSLGTLAGASTLGLLIPPSINLIVYGVVVDESIGRLFIAGVVPGILLALLFASYVFAWGALSEAGKSMREDRVTLPEIGQGLINIAPVVILIGGIIGSIFFEAPTMTSKCRCSRSA